MNFIMCLLLPLLLAFASSLHHILAQSPPAGFISLDCGLQGHNGSLDPFTGLYYTPDDDYVETGEGRSISPEFKASLAPKYWNVRSFPGPEGSRNCYTFRPLYGKGNKILLRLGFLYGNYDDQNRVPEFDLYLGVNIWETITLDNSSSRVSREIIHTPTSDNLQVCLVNTGRGTPFISMIELRPFDPSQPIYNTTSGSSLKYFGRLDLGSRSNNAVRYKNDTYDRTWRDEAVFDWLKTANTISINTTGTGSFLKSAFKPPPVVMRTAAQARTTNDSIFISFTPTNDLDEFYMYFHFAELVPDQSRELTMYLNDLYWIGPFVPPYLDVLTVMSTTAMSFSSYTFKINATSKSNLPAILNALEVYTVQQFLYNETGETDVAAITGVKATYAITENWQGDPCSPQKFSWVGVICRYKGFEPPNILSLNLSSSGLNGNIAPSISNLTMLESLDLSYNNLSGQVPDFLSWLPSLRYVYLKGNNFTGSLPPALLEKSKNGSLNLSIDFPGDHALSSCPNDASCKKKKRPNLVVPVLASVGAIFAIFTLSILLYGIIRRRRQATEKVTQTTRVVELESNSNNDSIPVPKLRNFMFSEIMSFIGDEMKILGEGGFGTVYHGCMNGVEVAVKILKVSPEQQTKDFKAEVEILGKVYHKNLTRILGYCKEGINRAIIFELMENGSLKNHLSESNPNVLSWEVRLAIMTGAAQGLEYLHHGCKPPIIHRDIKPENILLTKEFQAKIADFGLSRIFPVQSSRVIGTPGYHDPEYRDPGMVTEKVDVYSFGVVMLVVVTGQPAIIQGIHITNWITPKIGNGDIRGIIDPRLEGNYDVNAAWKIVELATDCVSGKPSRRPNMHRVVTKLQECLETAQTRRDEGADDAALIGTVIHSDTSSTVFSPHPR